MDVAVCRKSYLECGSRVRMRKVGRNIVRQKKDAEGVVYMTMDQKAKQRVGEKKGVVVVSCLKDESGAVKVSGWSKENLEGAYGKVEECWKWMEW